MKIIDNFKDDDYSFLMNSCNCVVMMEGEFYPTVEHAFQAAKTFDLQERTNIRRAQTAREAKRIGRRVTIRPDWDNIRVNVMSTLLRQKFDYSNKSLRNQLLATRNAKLVAGGDTFWGQVDGVGQNKLGELLMETREAIVDSAVHNLKISLEEYLDDMGWECKDDNNSPFGECWTPPWSPNCQYDLESAIFHQLKMSRQFLTNS